MGFTFFTDENGSAFWPVGLQAHNSSTGTNRIQKAIRAVKVFGGNCLEAPVYWYRLEPEQDRYETEHVRSLIDQARQAGLRLILLWFGTSKNGHPNYVPEYIKTNPGQYRLVIGPDGAVLPALSPHCAATLERDKRAFVRLMEFLKEYDGETRTVLAVQIENETGCAGTDRDYSGEAEREYRSAVPEALKGICPADSGRELVTAPDASEWKKQFGRHAHEAFTAWHHARFVSEIARAGKEVYPLAFLVNVMVGESGFEEAGLCYNAGAAVGRMLDIWKAGAPEIDLLCPDIYHENQREYRRICRAYDREDNPLFIPESPVAGQANAMNALLAAAEFGAVGLCCFGAESALDEDGNLNEASRDMALTMRTLSAMTPLLLRYRKTGCIYAIAEEEFETYRYLRLDGYHVIAHFLHSHPMNLGYTQEVKTEQGRKKVQVRGRALLIRTGEHEFYLGGAGVALDFIKRPHPQDENCFRYLNSRYAGQLNFLSVEEGHFENGSWITDRYRNGDETNFSQYVLEGEVIRIRLNPVTGMEPQKTKVNC